MAYGPSNFSAVPITNYGARGDWVNDDTNAIRRAISYVSGLGGGTVLLPKGNYLTSGYIDITASNITLLAEEGAWIRTAPSGDFRKFNISGASGVSIINLGIDAGRVSSGRAEKYTGTINVYSAPNFQISNCTLAHSEGLLLHFRGDTSNALVKNNTFTDFHIGIFSDSNDISGIAPTYLTIDKNQFLASWGNRPEQNYFGGVKLQNVGFERALSGYGNYVPARSRGHKIINNTFSGTSQMGIELWAYISDSVVANNYIEGSAFGISIAASSYDITVDSNNIYGCYGYGIESADAVGITISNNTIEGAIGNIYTNQGVCRTEQGIIINGVNRKPNNVNLVGNIVRNCSSKSISIFDADQANIVGNTIINTALNAGTTFYNQNSSHVNFSNNLLNQISTGLYFIFLDGGSSVCSGIRITNNDLNGSISQWGVFYYDNNVAANGNYDVLIENNNTTNVKYCGYGMVNSYANPPKRALQRNNFGSTGGGYIIPDAQYPAGSSPYGTSNIIDGFQYYNSASYSFTGGIPVSSGAWMKIASLERGLIVDTRFKVMHPDQGPPYNYDGGEENIEFRVVNSPYGLGAPIVSVEPQGRYFQGFTNSVINEIRTNNPGNGAIHEVWMNIISGSSAVSGYVLNIYGSDSSLVTSPTLQWNQPSWSSNSVGIKLNTSNPALRRETYGYGIGSGVSMYSPDGAALNLSASGNINLMNVKTATTAGSGSAVLPPSPVGFITLGITGGVFKVPYYNI